MSLETPDCSCSWRSRSPVSTRTVPPVVDGAAPGRGGMRSISLAVDISNYVMLETGQPNHCYDADALAGGIVVRNARPASTW